MDPASKELTSMELAQLASWIAAIIAGLTTAAIAIRNFRKSIDERKLDLLWKQASAAKDFVHEIHENEFAFAAISMMDWFVIDKAGNFNKGKITELKYPEVLEAIPKIKDRSYNDKEHYILDCFDWFFYYIDRTEQHIVDGLFLFDNVKYIFYPYYRKIYQNKELYLLFMKERYYLLAPDFFKRFESDPNFNK